MEVDGFVVMKKAIDVTRSINGKVERELWGRAAARCEFSDCNKLLYKSHVTQEPVNLAEMAHIYSFSKDGPRGWGPFKFNRTGLNDVGNLMLVCHDCHKKIDQDIKGERYSPGLLIRWKSDHENRVRIATGIPANKRSHVVFYGSRIGEENSPLQFGSAYEAMFPDSFPADDRPINLSMHSALDDSTPEFWIAHEQHLKKEFDRHIRPRIDEGQPNHFSIFALASQPLLIQLGALFTDKVPAIVYQPVREPKTWRRQPNPDGFCFTVNEPDDKSGEPVVIFSISDKVAHNRVSSVFKERISIWEVTSSDCHNDCLRSEAQLSEFRTEIRKLFVSIRAAHPDAKEIRIFPVMPVACAIELGRLRMPKADLPWIIFDHHNKANAFVKRLTIGANQ